MKKSTLRRIVTVATATLLCAGSAAMFAGCTSNHPKVTITYQFDGKEYAVEYMLSRVDAPNTVQHFIELADAGFYDGLCVHDYDGTYMYSGGYRLTEDKTLEAVDYFSTVKQLEVEKKTTFTQSVWSLNGDAPLYTVYGEFEENGNLPADGREYTHKQGALVMYYTDKGTTYNPQVKTVRNDNGKDNDGEPYSTRTYKYNSATSLFYTCLNSSASSILDKTYCVFGMAVDYSGQMKPLLDAIQDYIDSMTDEDDEEEASFTEEVEIKNVNEYEQFEEYRKGDISATYDTPVEMPIIVKTVKVTKY